MTQDTLIEQNMVISLTTKMNNILNFAKVIIVIDLCLIIYGIAFQSFNWVLNTQVAFVGSLFITLASFISYRKNILRRVANFQSEEINLKVNDRDKIDEIDDPYDLYSENEELKEEELTSQKIKEIIKEEKTKVKKNSFKNALFSASAFISIYRVMGYVVLLIGFFALNNSNKLLPIPFLIGLAVVPISVLLARFTLKLEEDQ